VADAEAAEVVVALVPLLPINVLLSSFKPPREGAAAFLFLALAWKGARLRGLRRWISRKFKILSVFIRVHLWLKSFADVDDIAH